MQPSISFKKQFQVKKTLSVVNKNIYILLFDEYPNMKILEKYENFSNQDIKKFLANNGFTEEANTFSNFTQTEASTVAILTGTAKFNSNINQAIDAVSNNIFSSSQLYDFYYFSIFDDFHRPNSAVSIHFFRSIDNFSIRYVIPFFLSVFIKKGIDNFYDYEIYNKEALEFLKSFSKVRNKHVVYVHFFTPHYFPLVEGESIQERINNANFYIKKSVNLISDFDPSASIIILSDHGLRKSYIPRSEHNKNLLFYKNIYLDTINLRKEGTSAVFKNFKN